MSYYYQGPNQEQNPNEYGQGYSPSSQQPDEPQQQGNAQQYNQGYYQPGGTSSPNYSPPPPSGDNPYYNPPPYNQQQQWFGGQQRSSLTSLGLDPRLESALCYALGWISGLVLLFVEKQNREVRYHALQSVIVFGSLHILTLIVPHLWIIGGLLGPFLGFVTLVAWIGLMVTAYVKYPVKIPYVSEFADRNVDRIRV